MAQAEWAARGGGISPKGLILTQVFSCILKIYVSFLISQFELYPLAPPNKTALLEFTKIKLLFYLNYFLT